MHPELVSVDRKRFQLYNRLKDAREIRKNDIFSVLTNLVKGGQYD